VVVSKVTNRLFIGSVSGIDNLPISGGYVLVANHSSFMDHFIIATVLKRYRQSWVYYLTKKEAFTRPLSRMWHVSLGCIPLNRNSADTTAFRTVLKYLSEGKIVCIYPEGTRSFTGKITQGKYGAVKLAMISKVPIVPVGLRGTFDILPKHRLVPRRLRASVEIGPPIMPKTVGSRGMALESLTKQIMDDLQWLSHQLVDTKSVDSSAPTVKEQIDAAREWNEMGIRPTEPSMFSADIAHRRAKYICEEILRNEGPHADAYFELGRALGRMALNGRGVKRVRLAMKSKKMLHKTLSLNSKHAHAYYSLGIWHFDVPRLLGGSKKLALEYYKKAVELDPNEIFFYMGLAKCQTKLGFVQGAKYSLEKVLLLHTKSNYDVRRKLEALAQLLRWNPEYRLESGSMEVFQNLRKEKIL
jgi:1-acyl-sn-glycerol-3-phosphate acyltransferase